MSTTSRTLASLLLLAPLPACPGDDGTTPADTEASTSSTTEGGSTTRATTSGQDSTSAESTGGEACGNGVVDPGEDCDDGNDSPGDGCEDDCSFSCELDADCGEAAACLGAPSCTDHVCTQLPTPPGPSTCTTEDRSDGVCIDGQCVPSCAPDAPFELAEPVVELDLPDSRSLEAVLSDDQLTVYFSSDRAGGAGDLDIWMATRVSAGDPFGPPEPVVGINTSARESYPAVTADGLELFAQTTAVPGPFAIVVATRASVADPFGPFALVMGPNDDNAYDPFVLRDGSALYLGSDRDGSPDLYRAPRVGLAPEFAAVTPISAGMDVVNTASLEGHPVPSFDERVLYFGSDRPGPPEGGDADVYVATRESAADPFSAASFVAGVNGPSRDLPTWISLDQCTLYLQRQPNSAGANLWEIWRATRTP